MLLSCLLRKAIPVSAGIEKCQYIIGLIGVKFNAFLYWKFLFPAVNILVVVYKRLLVQNFLHSLTFKNLLL